MDSQMDVLIYKLVATPDECLQLTQWALSAPSFSDGITTAQTRTKQRQTNRNWRMCNELKPVYPALVFDIQKRIAALTGLSNVFDSDNHGADGVVVNITMDGGDVYEHRDPPSQNGEDVTRCNLLVSEQVCGGIFSVEGQTISEWHEGDVVRLNVTKLLHGASKVSGGKPRVNFLFGFIEKDAKTCNVVAA
jgi:hypothetical protein